MAWPPFSTTETALNFLSEGLMERRRKNFFFEKKKQKTFVNFAASLLQPTFPSNSNRQKFFGSFFQKRTPLP
jgi:hypothetical protein